jgi:hypothetical protein
VCVAGDKAAALVNVNENSSVKFGLIKKKKGKEKKMVLVRNVK